MRQVVFFILFVLSIGSIRAQETSDSIVKRYLRDELNAPVTSNNTVKLLTSGHDKFIDLFENIRQARHHVHLEYFNFRNDSIANALFDLLAEKVKEGVEVRAMFDAFGNSSNNQPLKQNHLDSIAARGIEIVKFDPIKFPWINHAMHRDHRKIVVIDGRIGYTGGMNIADYYIHGLPEIGKWRDMHMHLEGEVVHCLQEIFLAMWNKETRQNIEGAEYFPDEKLGGDSLDADNTDDAAKFSSALSAQSASKKLGGIEIAIVDRWPRRTPKSIRRAYAASILSAQKSVRIVNPYFVPTRKVRRAIKKALKKGTEVEIMIPSRSDIPFTPDAAFSVVHKLMKRGAKVYLFNDGFHHTKIMMVDSIFCTVGTANLNSRSLRYDYETNAFIFSPCTTGELNEMFERDKAQSTLLTPEVWKKRSRWKKFVGWIGNLATPFL